MAKCRQMAFPHTHTTQIFSNCSWVKNRAENCAQPKTLLNNKNRHSRRSKHKILQNAERRHFLHKYFQIGTCEQPLHNVNLKKTYFYKGNTLSKRFRGQVPRAQIQVCVSTKQSSWPRGGQFVIFGLCCCCHTFPLKCRFSWCEKALSPNRLLGGPWTGPFFEETRSPWQPSGIYIYIMRLGSDQFWGFHKLASGQMFFQAFEFLQTPGASRSVFFFVE